MFGRIFGRGKDDPDQAVCAECGRTLLAGEWTQKVIDDRRRGETHLLAVRPGVAGVRANRWRQRPHRPTTAACASRAARSFFEPIASPSRRPAPRRGRAPVAAAAAAAPGGARRARRERRLLAGAQGQGRADRAAQGRAGARRGRAAGARRPVRAPRHGRRARRRGARLPDGRLVGARRAHVGRDTGGVRGRDGGAPRGRAGAGVPAGRRRPGRDDALEPEPEDLRRGRPAELAGRPPSRRRSSRPRRPQRPPSRRGADRSRRAKPGRRTAAARPMCPRRPPDRVRGHAAHPDDRRATCSRPPTEEDDASTGRDRRVRGRGGHRRRGGALPGEPVPAGRGAGGPVRRRGRGGRGVAHAAAARRRPAQRQQRPAQDRRDQRAARPAARARRASTATSSPSRSCGPWAGTGSPSTSTAATSTWPTAATRSSRPAAQRRRARRRHRAARPGADQPRRRPARRPGGAGDARRPARRPRRPPAEPEPPRVAAQKAPGVPQQVAARPAQRRRVRVVGADAGTRLRLGPLSDAAQTARRRKREGPGRLHVAPPFCLLHRAA